MMTRAESTAQQTDALRAHARARELFDASYHRVAIQNDRLFSGLLVLEWLAAIILACTRSPFTYSGSHRALHVHVYAAIFAGFVIVSFPLFMIRHRPGSALTRHCVAAGQMVLTGLLIGIAGGRVETHFLIFGSLAFLACYGDWRVLITASSSQPATIFLRNVAFPWSFYGTDIVSSWRWLEHSAYVGFEDVFLILSCFYSMRERRGLSARQTELEFAEAELLRLQRELETKVETRTAEMSRTCAWLADEVTGHQISQHQLRQAQGTSCEVAQ